MYTCVLERAPHVLKRCIQSIPEEDHRIALYHAAEWVL